MQKLVEICNVHEENGNWTADNGLLITEVRYDTDFFSYYRYELSKNNDTIRKGVLNDLGYWKS